MTERAHARLRASLLLTSLIVLLLAVGYLRPGDFESFYIAGAQLLKGLNPYNPELYKTYRSFGMSSLPPALVLTCLPCFLPLTLAISVWDVLCLLLWSMAIYLWVDLLKDSALHLPEFAQVGAACLIAPLIWAFQTHQVTVPVFFWASLAVWATRRGHPGRAGFSVGCMLMKPHLTLLLAAALFLKTRRKFLFVAGVGAGLILPYIPFMNTVRPLADLRGWARTIERQQTEVYYLDEQDLLSRITILFPIVTHAEAKTSNGPGILIPKPKGQFLARIKMAFWLVGCGLWVLWVFSTRWVFWARRLRVLPSYRRNRHTAGRSARRLAEPVPSTAFRDWAPAFAGVTSTSTSGEPSTTTSGVTSTSRSSDLWLYAISFAWGLLISPYSHFYDGVLLTPLILCVLYENSRSVTELFPVFFGFNFLMIVLVTLANHFNLYLWPLMGWTTVLYCAIAASIYRGWEFL